MRPGPARFPILRPPPTRVVLAAALALLCGVVVHGVTSRAAATAQRYGTTAPVWVATDDLAAGQELGPGDVTAEERPVGLLPDGAVTRDPTGRVVRAATARNEVVVDHRLADGDRTGVAALVPPGWRAVAVPAFDAVPPVEVGHRVDVLVSGEPGAAGTSVGGLVAADAVVVHVADDGTTTVAVPAERAARVAAALVSGAVTLAIVG